MRGAQFKVDAKAAKALRDKTGAGMMDAKKALTETEGDFDKAVEYLRKKGLASADKKSGRVAAEGVVASYIHAGSRSARLIRTCPAPDQDIHARPRCFAGGVACNGARRMHARRVQVLRRTRWV